MLPSRNTWDETGRGARASPRIWDLPVLSGGAGWTGGVTFGPFPAGDDSTGGRSQERAGGAGKAQETL